MKQLELFPQNSKNKTNEREFIKIASWNVNSIRARKEQVVDWLKRESPDIACIQETKVKDEEFPKQDFVSMGYNVEFYGEAKYNGVAILSKYRIEDVVRGFDGSPDVSARVISCSILGLRVYNIYAPNAKSLKDYSLTQKIRWYNSFIEHIKRNHRNSEPLILCGDFNVVSKDHETFDSKHWLCSTMVDNNSRSAFSNLLNLGFIDIMRSHYGKDSLYTWWDYGDGLMAERGMRLDYFLATPTLINRINNSRIDRLTREKQKSSDHAPIICELKL